MSSKPGIAVALAVTLFALERTAAAQNTAEISFTGDAFTIPQNTFACGKVSYPPSVTNLEMKLGGGTGDGDLYVCSGHMTPSECLAKVTASPPTHLCQSVNYGNAEDCSGSVVAGGNYTLCIYGYTAVTNITANVGFTAANSGATTSAAASGSNITYWIDYFKDNLFLGIAYHRVGCMSSWNGSSGQVVSDLDYDFFSDGNYCRRGEDWKSGPESHGTSHVESFGLGSSFTSAQTKLNDCGNATNTAYGTPNYKRRSNTCSYNILTNCNSDCAIKHFSNCVDGASGDGIDIVSPCW